MIEQALKNISKTSSLSHRPSPVFATRKLAGFAAQAMFVDSVQSQTRDGFSFDVLGKSVLQSAYSANIPAQKYRDGHVRHPETPDRHPETSVRHPELVSGSASNGRNERGTEIGTRYRYIDDTPLVPLSEAAAGGGSSAAAGGAKTRSRASSEYVLYSHGAPAAVNSDDGTSYFGTDILGSVRNVTDKYGAVQSSYDYDAFGSPYLGNLENDIGFGYCGKVYDVGTGLYDYGFRDYSPVSARFTTVDPIRDGSNWFSYVVNDPVNYVDPLGLNAFDDFIYGKQETIEVDGQKITVQQSSPLLETLAKAKDKASDKLINWGNKTGIELFTKLGESVSQIPTGRVDNQTNYYLAFAGEYSKLGEAYLAPNSVTYLFKDYVVTRGESSGMTAKMISIGDVTVNQSEIIFSPATIVLNNTANSLKNFFNEPGLGQWINNRIDNITGKSITTEQYGIYNNKLVLDNIVKDQNGNPIDLKKLSGNLNVFAGKKESNNLEDYSNPSYFEESNNDSTNSNNPTFNNINFNSSASSYIGFNSFSGGCTK